MGGHAYRHGSLNYCMYKPKNSVRYTWSDTHITRYKKVSRLVFTMDMIY